MNIKDLKKLPVRDWKKESTYKTISVIYSGKKHNQSGWALMHIIGFDDKGEPIEIAATCDDIYWKIPKTCTLRTDMHYPGGVIHFWSEFYFFKVGYSHSTVFVELVQPK